jgi:hypothetical protein
MSQNKLKMFNPRAICDNCGFKFYMSDLRPYFVGDSFTGMFCLPNKCWNPPHPFDFPLPVIPDGLPILNARPEPAAVFVQSASGGLSTWGGAWVSSTGTYPNPTWGELTDFWELY